jgi:RHS repeat-associated protein
LAIDDGEDLFFHRVWVRLTLNSTTYWLDPAFKIHYPLSGINLTTAMGLDTNQLIAVAGGTTNADYVVSLSEANLRTKLRDYTTNFLYYLQTNSPNATVGEILGEQYVPTSVGAGFPQALTFIDLNAYSTNWDYIPTNLMTSLRITVDGTNQSLVTPQLQGQRLSLTFTTNGLGQLWLDDELLLQKQTSGGSTVNVGLSIDHPFGSWNLSSNLFVSGNKSDQSTTNTYQRTNASYAITYAFEPDHEWLRQRQERLDRYRKQGLADTSREVVTETLNVMGLNWMLQTERIPRVLAAQQNMLLQHHHRLGRMAQEFGRGYYIDIYQQLSGIMPASGVSTNDYARADRVFDLENYFGSAAEHGLIEQLQSSNLVAASTVKMLQIGNTNGQRTYLAKSSNWTTVQANLSNYNLNFLKTNYIDRGYSVLLPANGSNLISGVGSWAGYGLVARVATSTNYAMSMAISGGYNGGYVGNPTVTPSPPVISQFNYVQPSSFIGGSALLPPQYAADPVNMTDGSFHLSNTDISLGQSEPRGLRFTRYYSSARRYHNVAGMAHGWLHNYHLKADDVSATLPAFGDTTPAQMAALVVATKSAFELYTTTGNPKNWAVTSLIAKWGVDQLINNAVSISMGDGMIQFIKQPDGSFTPPAKSTMTLLKTNGVYWLQERHGNTFKFNGAGLLTNIVDQYNQGLKVTYGTGGASNWVATVTDWTNRMLTLTYSGTPLRLTSVADNASPTRTISFGYTTNAGQLDLTSVTDAESKTSTFLYDTNHQMVATKDALNRVITTNLYDGFGRVIEQYSQGDPNQTWKLYWSGYLNIEENPAGGRTYFRYDEKRRLTQKTDALNHARWTFYDGQDHVIQTISSEFAVTDFYHDGRHNLTAINDPLGAQKDFFYDAQDNLTRSEDERGNTNWFGYNPKFQLTGSTNGAGDWITFTYHANGTLATTTDAGGTTTFDYDSFGQLNRTTYPGSLGSEGLLNNSLGDTLSRTNARGFVTSFQYNLRRELTNTIAPTNLTAKVSYDAAGNVHSVTDARGFTASNTWSATRKLLATALPTTPQGVPVTTNAYDNRDWLTRTVNPLQAATLFTNDAAQRLVSVTDPLNRTTKFGYDADNRNIATTNAANEVTRQAWNGRSELTQITTPLTTTIKHSYDAAGNQITLTNRNGKKWQFQFDAANRLTNTITPLNRQTWLAYNNRGLLDRVREPSGQWATNFYDAKGRQTNSADSVATRLFRYDANNNVTNIVENGKTNAWVFDAYDRVSSYRDADGNLIQYRHDANGNLTNLIYPGNRVVAYAYDSLNRVTNVTDWANRQTSFEYDLASRLKKITRPNGTVRDISYDAAGQTTNIWERTGAGLPIALFRLNWNNAARVEWEFAAPIPQTYTPPARTMTFDDDNRLLTFNSNSVTNDDDGNLTWGPLTNTSFATYTYDARNRLLNVGGLSYGYDPAGNRTSITNGANVTRLVVNPNAALSQVLMRVRSGVTNFYIFGMGLQYEITETATSTNTLTYHYDYRGSTVALTDGNGNVTDRINYSPYASITFRSGTNDTPFLYNGRYGVQTDANGLLYMRARFYNAYLCRFLNADPSGFSGGLNHYAYADGNPVSMIDPFGLGATEIPGIYEPNSWFGIGGVMDQAFDALDVLVNAGANYTGKAIGAAFTGLDNILAGKTLDGSADSGIQPWVAQALVGAAVGKLIPTPAGASGGTAYRAVNPAYAESTAQSGFYRSGAAGRLGNDGIYVNSTIEGAIAEFQFHNPGVSPAVFRVQYPVGSTLNISPPSGYFNQPLPFTQGANILTAPSLRAPGTMNMLIREGAVPAGRTQ